MKFASHSGDTGKSLEKIQGGAFPGEEAPGWTGDRHHLLPGFGGFSVGELDRRLERWIDLGKDGGGHGGARNHEGFAGDDATEGPVIRRNEALCRDVAALAETDMPRSKYRI